MQRSINTSNDQKMFSKEDEMKIVRVQRRLRGMIRKNIHETFFGKPPRVSMSIPKLPEPYQNNLGKRFSAIVKELSQQQAVICGNKINHFTTLHNLKNIIRGHYMYGNDTLKRRGIVFNSNALDTTELTDLDTICFAPARVDNIALSALSNNDVALKEDLCAIVCDLTHLSYPRYNQFFKLNDMHCGHYRYQVEVNNELTIQTTNIRNCGNNFWFIFALQGKEYVFPISYEQSFFYGDLTSINLFCLTRLIDYVLNDDIFDKLKLSDQDKNHVLGYLQSLSDDELRKVLIITAQALTYFSEYNVHSYLDLNDIRINEIRLYDDKCKYDFSGLNEDEYQQCLQHVANHEFNAPLMRQCFKALPKDECLTAERDLAVPFKAAQSFSALPSGLFSTKSYLETRLHVNNTEDNVFAVVKHT